MVRSGLLVDNVVTFVVGDVGVVVSVVLVTIIAPLKLSELVPVEIVLRITAVVSVDGPVEPAELVPVEVALVFTVVVSVVGALQVREVVPFELAELVVVVVSVKQDELVGDTVATDDAVELV